MVQVSTSTNPLGQFTDELVGELKQTVVSEPKKILEQILGSKPTQSADSSLETDPGSQLANDPTAQQAKQQADMMVKKQQADQTKSAALIRLHRQRLDEEKQYFEQKKQEKEMEKKQEEQADEQKKQQQVIQLQHEQAKEDVLGSMLKQQEGSKEAKAWGAG
jgi:hypothetical protein